MSIKHSIVLACFGFLTGASFASANLEAVQDVTQGESWSCGDHYWGLTLELVDEDQRVGEVDFHGDGWNARPDVAPADIEIDRAKNEILFVVKDELGGKVRLRRSSPLGEDAAFDAVAQETSESGEVSIGTCQKN